MGISTSVVAQISSPTETLTQSTAKDTAKSLFLAGKAAHDGIGEAQNYDKARHLYAQAAELGSPEALINLGYLHFVGQGVPVDRVKARYFYTAAASLGSRDARANIAMMDARGLGLSKTAAPLKTQASVVQPKQPKENTVHPPVKKSPRRKDILAKDTNAPRPPLVKDVAPEDKIGNVTSTSVSEANSEAEGKDIDSELKSKSNVKRDYSALIELPKQERSLSDKTNDLGVANVFQTMNLNTKIAISLLSFALLTLLLHALKRRKIKQRNRIKRLFAETFYDAYRSDLRLTYLRRRNCHFVEATFYKQWTATLKALMARFALAYDGPDPALEAFCKRLNADLSSGLLPTRKLAFEFSDPLMDATVSEIKAIDAFHKEALTSAGSESYQRKSQAAYKIARPSEGIAFLAEKTLTARQAR